MGGDKNGTGSVLAELLRLQRWAGGDLAVPASRIYGLANGFESALEDERERGISRETERAVAAMLEEVEAEKQPADGSAIQERLRNDGVNEADAARVMTLYSLQERYTDGIARIASAAGSAFSGLTPAEPQTHGWAGALHYIELVEQKEGERDHWHAVMAPSVPQVGELVRPERGTPMEVIAVEHQITTRGAEGERSQPVLVPFVILKSLGDGEDEEERPRQRSAERQSGTDR